MQKVYNILMDNETVGSAEVSKIGLYYQIKARCKSSRKQRNYLYVQCNGRKIDLGLMVPEENWLVLSRGIPIKRLGEGTLKFVIEEREHIGSVSVVPERKFEGLERLEDARLLITNGKKHIFFVGGQNASTNETGQ